MLDIVLLHPPAILLSDPYPVFPMPWCPEFIGSTDDLDHFPMPERFTAIPAGLYALKSDLLAEGRSAEVLNLDQLSGSVTARVSAHLQPSSGPVDSMPQAWEEAYGAVKALIERYPGRLFGIDLQWLVYAADLRELAQIDPGSPAFTAPRRFGYRLLWTRFSEAVSHMRHPHPFARRNFSPVHEESPSSFFRNLLDVLDLMNRVYAAHHLCSEQWTRRASRYNGILREFWAPCLMLETIDSAYERRKAFLQLGQELIERYYE